MTAIRRTVLALCVSVLTALTLLPAATAEAAVHAPVGGGTAIIVDGKAACTMTAVGRDRYGNLVGLTAAHCGKVGAWVAAERHSRAGVIGQIALANSKVDVAVISLYPERVRAQRTVGRATIRSVGRFPAAGSTVCKNGRTTGFTCGPVLYETPTRSSSYVCGNAGDSGGPVLQGTRVVAMLNGRQKIPGTDFALHCETPALPLHTPMVATKMSFIVAELTRHGRVGADFRPI